MFPLPPKPKGVIAPEFLNVLKNEDLNTGDTTDDDSSTDSSRERTATDRPSRRAARKEVDYSELNIDDDGNDASTGGRKRKNPVKKEPSKGKSSKKTRRSSTSSTKSMSESDAESDFTIELSDDEESSYSKDDDDDTFASDKEQDGDDAYATSLKRSRKLNSIPWNEIPLEATGLVSRIDQADHERMVRYRKSAEQVQKWLKEVDTLDLPPNPLDRLLNELGGPR